MTVIPLNMEVKDLETPEILIVFLGGNDRYNTYNINTHVCSITNDLLHLKKYLRKRNGHNY